MEDKNIEQTNDNLLSELSVEKTQIFSSKSDNSHTISFIVPLGIKNSSDTLQYPRSYIYEDFVIIWLDPNISKCDNDYQSCAAQVQRIIPSINIYSDVDECVDFVTQLEEKQICMVVASDIGYHIVPLIHEISQLNRIYIYSADRSSNEQWTQKWKKVKGVFAKIEFICGLLKRDIQLNDIHSISFTILPKDASLNTHALNELDRSFMYSLLLKEIFLDMDDDDQSRKEFVEFWRLQYSDNNAMLKIIDQFDQEYDSHFAIWWYTKEHFIYSNINRALRELDIDTTMKMKFFIRDLYRQIKQLYTESSNKQSSLTVYRGQSILNADFERIKNNNGGLIAFNNFLSTSTERQISLFYADSAEHNSNLTTVHFSFHINNTTDTYPYAFLSDISYYESENEILLSMHTIFRIGDVRHIKNRLFEVDLTLTSDNDHRLNSLTDHIREEIGGGTGWHRLGNMMIRLGEFDKAKEIYETLLHSAQDNDGTEITHLYHQLGYIQKEKGDFTTALLYFQKAVDIQERCFSLDDPLLALIYNRIGSIHHDLGEYQTALFYHQKALDTQKRSLPSNHSDIGITYSNMGDVYCSMDDSSTALSFYQMTLVVQQQCLPPNDPALAITYNCIGSVYNNIENYETALSFYEKALDIEQKFLPANHPSLGSTYNNIGDVHCRMGDYSTALSLYEKTLQIQQKSYSTDHVWFAFTYERIGKGYQALEDYANAMLFYQKSIEIREKHLPPYHSSLAICYANIGTLHDSLGDFTTALSFYQKAREIQEKNLGTTNSQLGKIYNNLGHTYQSMKDYSTALSYYQKTLELWQKPFPPNYSHLAIIFNNLGVVHDLMKDYVKALEFHKQALEIKEKLFPSNHISLATTYNNIGDLYRSTGDYPLALSYLRKTLAIEQHCLSAEHPDLAITYNNIAKVFACLREYHLAKEYSERAINIARRALGPMHPDVQLFQDSLNEILEKL